MNAATLNKLKTVNAILDLNEEGDIAIPVSDVLLIRINKQ